MEPHRVWVNKLPAVDAVAQILATGVLEAQEAVVAVRVTQEMRQNR